ncbi:MAG: HEAT repeat domain-containing protein [Pirellulales bacterium]
MNANQSCGRKSNAGGLRRGASRMTFGVALSFATLSLTSFAGDTSLFATRPCLAEEPVSAVGPLMKLFQSGRLPAERQGTVVEMICKRGNEHDLRVVFEKAVTPEGFPADLRRQSLAWLTDSATTRKVKPAGDLSAIEALVVGESAAKDPELRQSAIKLASAWKDASVAPALAKLAADAQTKPALRRVAIEGLVAIGGPVSRAAVEKLVGADQPMVVRVQAVAALTGFDLDAAAKAGATLLAEASPKDDPAEMISAFLNRKNGAAKLGEALASKSLKPDVAKVALRYMYSVGHSDAALSDVLSKSAGIATDAPPPTPEEVSKIVAEVTTKGDPARGERIFRRKDLSCMKCHSVSRAGGQVGPELSAVGGSSPVDYVVNSILNPNLAIKEQYVTRVFELASGNVITGIVIDRDDVRVNLRDVNGKQMTIPTADIDEEAEGRSLMPQGLTMFLTRDELVDLARFVSELGKPGPYAVQQAKRAQRWRVLGETPAELVAEVPHLENLRQFVFGAAPEAWQPAYGQVNGQLPLDELRGPAGSPTTLILQTEINVSDEGPVRIQIDSTEEVHTWVGSDAIDAKRDAIVNLPAGRHTLTFHVRVSDRERPTLKVDFSVPDGASTNFEMVGGA